MKTKSPYQLYDRNGKEVRWADFIRTLSEADVVLFGELHNNTLGHWLELQVAKDLWEVKKGQLVLGAEMFEADAQIVLDEYLAGTIKVNHLETEAKIWNNYKTDYAPLVEFAREKQLRFVASNIPRRYANLVARKGLEELTRLAPDAQRYIAPLPIEVDMELPGYQNMKKMMGAHGGASADQMVHAQASKDATMAYFIQKNLQKGQLVLHFHGAYHSNNFEGIYWYLKKYRPELRIATISTVEQAAVQPLAAENTGLADYIFAIAEDMIKSY